MHERRTNDFNTQIRHVFVNMTGDQYEINRNVIYRNHQVSVTSNQVVGREVSRARPVRKILKNALAGTESRRGRAVRGKMQTTPKNRIQGWMWTRTSPRRGASTNARPDREPASSGFVLSPRGQMKPSLTTPSPAPRVPFPPNSIATKGRRLSSMLTAGFSLLKSLGKSATKRKRDGDEESAIRNRLRHEARALPSAVGNPAGASHHLLRAKDQGEILRPGHRFRPDHLRDRFQSVDEEPRMRRVHPPAVAAPPRSSAPQRRHGRAFLPDVLLLRRRVKVEVSEEDIRDSLGSGAESRGGGSASAARRRRGNRDGRLKADDSRRLRERGRLVHARGARSAPVFGRGCRTTIDPSRDWRGSLRRATRLRRDPTRRPCGIRGDAPRQSRTASGTEMHAKDSTVRR